MNGEYLHNHKILLMRGLDETPHSLEVRTPSYCQFQMCPAAYKEETLLAFNHTTVATK